MHHSMGGHLRDVSKTRPSTTTPSKSNTNGTTSTFGASYNGHTVTSDKHIGIANGHNIRQKGVGAVSSDTHNQTQKYSIPHRPLSTGTSDVPRDSQRRLYSIERCGGVRMSRSTKEQTDFVGFPSSTISQSQKRQCFLGSQSNIPASVVSKGASTPNTLNTIPRAILNKDYNMTSPEALQKQPPQASSLRNTKWGSTYTSTPQTIMHNKPPVNHSTLNAVVNTKTTTVLQQSDIKQLPCDDSTTIDCGKTPDLQQNNSRDDVQCDHKDAIDDKFASLSSALRKIGVYDSNSTVTTAASDRTVPSKISTMGEPSNGKDRSHCSKTKRLIPEVSLSIDLGKTSHDSSNSISVPFTELVADGNKKSLCAPSPAANLNTKLVNPVVTSCETYGDDSLVIGEPSPPLGFMERRHSGRWVNRYPASPSLSNKEKVQADIYMAEARYIGHFKCIICGTPIFRAKDKLPSVAGYATFSSYYAHSVKLQVSVPDSLSGGVNGDTFIAIRCVQCDCFIGRLSSASAKISTTVGKGVTSPDMMDNIEDDIVEANSCAILYSIKDAPAGFETAAEIEAKETCKSINPKGCMYPPGENRSNTGKWCSADGVAGGGVMAVRKVIERKGVPVSHSTDDGDDDLSPVVLRKTTRGRPTLLFAAPSCYNDDDDDDEDGDTTDCINGYRKDKSVRCGDDEGRIEDDELWATMCKRVKGRTSSY